MEEKGKLGIVSFQIKKGSLEKKGIKMLGDLNH